MFLEAVAGLCREAGVGVGDLERIVAVQGPGRYTGLRLGLAMTQGLHLATHVPVALLRRDVLYFRLLGQAGVVLCDSGRGQCFGSVWSSEAIAGSVMPSCRLHTEATLLEQCRSLTGGYAVLDLLPPAVADTRYSNLLAGASRVVRPESGQLAEALVAAEAGTVAAPRRWALYQHEAVGDAP